MAQEFTRKELYDLLWNQPMQTVAAESRAFRCRARETL